MKEYDGVIQKEFPVFLNKTNKNVSIYQANSVGDNDKKEGLGKCYVVNPDNGTGFESDGVTNTLSDRFGIELSFAK